MYSLMSTRITAFSSPNMASPSALHSSVLPTPVGPRNRKEPMGRLGSLSPARARRMERAMALTASSCPITRLCNVSSSCIRRSASVCVMRCTGTPVQLATIWATSSSSTTSRASACFMLHSRLRASISCLRHRSWSRSSAARSKAWCTTASFFSSWSSASLSSWAFMSGGAE